MFCYALCLVGGVVAMFHVGVAPSCTETRMLDGDGVMACRGLRVRVATEPGIELVVSFHGNGSCGMIDQRTQTAIWWPPRRDGACYEADAPQ
jgi:hypothetical protein